MFPQIFSPRRSDPGTLSDDERAMKAITFDRMRDGLLLLATRLGAPHGQTLAPPPDWTADEWQLVCDVAGNAILRLLPDPPA